METKKVKHSLEEHAMPIRTIAFSPDSQKILTGINNFDKLILFIRQGVQIYSFLLYLLFILCNLL